MLMVVVVVVVVVTTSVKQRLVFMRDTAKGNAEGLLAHGTAVEWTNSTGGFVLRAQASIRCLGTERHLMPLLHRGNSEVSHPFFEGVDLGLKFTPPQSGDAVLVIAEVVAGGYTDASACEILWPGRKHGASRIGGQRRSRRS